MHEVEEALGITLGRLNGDLAAEDAEGDHVLCLGLGIVGPGRGLDFESLGCTEKGLRGWRFTALKRQARVPNAPSARLSCEAVRALKKARCADRNKTWSWHDFEGRQGVTTTGPRRKTRDIFDLLGDGSQEKQRIPFNDEQKQRGPQSLAFWLSIVSPQKTWMSSMCCGSLRDSTCHQADYESQIPAVEWQTSQTGLSKSIMPKQATCTSRDSVSAAVPRLL